MARTRLAKNRGLPPNLYQNSAGYYYFKNPQSGKVKGVGRDKAVACAEARKANAALSAMTPSSLVDWVMGKADYSLADWLPIYKGLWIEKSEKPPAFNTMRTCELQLRKIAAAEYAWRSLPDISTAHIAQHITETTTVSGAPSAMNLRSRLSDVFRMAETQGLIPAGTNPVKATYTPSRTVKRERLSLEQFLAIREVAPTWLKNAMNLALVTAQRRDDIVTMKFSAYKDGRLNIEQGKTGTKLSLSGEIRLEAVGLSIAEVFAACRDAVVSRYVIHHTRPVSTARPGDPIGANGLSNGFKRARDSLNIVPSEGRTPPSFHEIRSLAERLYKAERGAEFAQAILGHKHASMTAVYDDMRGQGWAQIG